MIAQVLLATGGGARVAAREVLLNTDWVHKAIADGSTSRLPMAIQAGRQYGMVPLTDALIHYVRNGIVDVGEAYRHVADRVGFVDLLKRQGIDTSTIERVPRSSTSRSKPVWDLGSP